MAGEIKSGYKTTEFWVTVLAGLGALLAGLAENVDSRWAIVAAALSAAAYAVSRGLAKRRGR